MSSTVHRRELKAILPLSRQGGGRGHRRTDAPAAGPPAAWAQPAVPPAAPMPVVLPVPVVPPPPANPAAQQVPPAPLPIPLVAQNVVAPVANLQPWLTAECGVAYATALIYVATAGLLIYNGVSSITQDQLTWSVLGPVGLLLGAAVASIWGALLRRLSAASCCRPIRSHAPGIARLVFACVVLLFAVMGLRARERPDPAKWSVSLARHWEKNGTWYWQYDIRQEEGAKLCQDPQPHFSPAVPLIAKKPSVSPAWTLDLPSSSNTSAPSLYAFCDYVECQYNQKYGCSPLRIPAPGMGVQADGSLTVWKIFKPTVYGFAISVPVLPLSALLVLGLVSGLYWVRNWIRASQGYSLIPQ